MRTLLLLSLLAACAVDTAALGETDDAITATTLPLYTWYSPSRGDTFTTTNPAWAPVTNPDGSIAIKSPDYRYVATEGTVFSPSAPQPRDTVPLYSWYSPSRGDNFITSNPAWAGKPGDTRSPDYGFVRLEGYVYGRPLAGTRVLRSWYNASSGDNATTASPDWAPGTLHPGFGLVREEGYLLPVVERADDRVRAESFGFGRMTVKGKPALGERPLLLIRATMPDSPIVFEHDAAYYDDIVFGRAVRNVSGFFAEQSHQLFAWKRAGSIAITTDPGYMKLSTEAWLANLYSQPMGIDLAPYDTNHDGRITAEELVILVVTNKSTNHGGVRWINNQLDGCATPAGSSVAVCAPSAVVGEDSPFIGYVHELTHMLGGEDLYDSGYYNAALSTMGLSMVGATYGLDPWHKMQLGWVRPRIREIHDPGAAESLVSPRLSTASGITDESPILFYDATRGTSEYFLAEYRMPNAATYDADVNGYYHNGLGVAVWFVKQDANRDALLVANPDGTGQDRAVWLMAPNGIRGDTHLWSSLYSDFSLRWLDGSDVGIRLTVGDALSTNPIGLQWHPTAQALVPRIDSVRTGTKTDAVLVDGMFPVTRDIAAVTANGVYLNVTGWSPSQIQTTTELPYAVYTVRVRTSNAVDGTFGL
jgi:M6 family metalloprotease-like protein